MRALTRINLEITATALDYMFYRNGLQKTEVENDKLASASYLDKGVAQVCYICSL